LHTFSTVCKLLNIPYTIPAANARVILFFPAAPLLLNCPLWAFIRRPALAQLD
jgi:hypothetical protein